MFYNILTHLNASLLVRFSKILICTISLVFCFSVPAKAEYKISLDEIKKFALLNNFGVKAINEEIIEAKAQTIQKRSVFYPILSLNAGPEFLMQENQLGSQIQTLGYLSGQWNVFHGTQDRITLEISELNEKNLENNRSRIQFELELENLFYQVLYKVAKIKYNQESLELNQNHKKLIQQKKASGLASPADIMEFELRDSLLQSEISSIEQEKEEAKLGLIRLLWPSLETSFEPIGELPYLQVQKPLSDFLKQINSTSGSVKSSAFNLSIGLLGLNQTRYGWLPNIDFYRGWCAKKDLKSL